MEQQIKTTAKLYKCRDTAKSFFKEKYQDKLQPYFTIIKDVMISHDVKEIPALLMISKSETYQSDGMIQMMFMAAIVEMIESSK